MFMQFRVVKNITITMPEDLARKVRVSYPSQKRSLQLAISIHPPYP